MNHYYLTKIFASFLGMLVIFIIIKTFYNLILAYKNNFQPKTDPDTQASMLTIEKLRVMIFIKFFASCMTIPFFSRYVLSLAHTAGAPAQLASVAYIMYTIIFTLMIIPSGYLVEVKNLRFTLLIMLVLEAVVFFALGVTSNFWLIFAIQTFFGIIIPISSSAEYAYIFLFSNEKNRNLALASYTNTIRGAMIAGVFSGGLLLPLVNEHGIFLLSFALILCCAIYAFFLIPNVDCASLKCDKVIRKISPRIDLKSIIKNLPSLIKDTDVILSSLLTSLPLGFITEGVVFFSIPILLTKHNVPQPLIGEIIVLFSLGFFVTNKFIAQKADRNKKEKKFMFLGLLGAAFSIMLISFFTANSIFKINISENIGMYSLMIGLFVLGMFRGFMLSPSIALASKSKSAKAIGQNVTVSVYRLFGSLGRTIGPIVISYLLITSNYSSKPFLFISIMFILIAVAFPIVARSAATKQSKKATDY